MISSPYFLHLIDKVIGHTLHTPLDLLTISTLSCRSIDKPFPHKPRTHQLHPIDSVNRVSS